MVKLVTRKNFEKTIWKFIAARSYTINEVVGAGRDCPVWNFGSGLAGLGDYREITLTNTASRIPAPG
uniref:Uncharacterized protein n=1 Tax=Candidatus Kentrum sp. SD TaxID=2126332 RepID=A0A450YPS0_9GAMM|nr:MAG: hypothetical protein BECKSD772F_GA0070984_10247 [Candidatus Kentron sp. SD]VFK43528.1 MAG: hypothetical protein BECKSD772E_GA0070983_102629 [Candidatus Kentron sp. SD]VFK79584.1 MAG: hypothetical protein BECKSD772D_GA0070982_105518 [Candidatus Kentron sp. SD]